MNAADGFEQAAIAAVAASEGERLEQPRDAMILDRAIVAASLVAEGAGNPALADPGRDSVTMPGVRRSRSGSTIRFILGAGQMVQVEHRKRFAGEDHLVVVQPDGTLALIPSWMSGGDGSLCHSHHVPSVVGRTARRAARANSMRFSPLQAGHRPRVKEAIMQPRHHLQRRPVRGGSQDDGYSGVRRGAISSA